MSAAGKARKKGKRAPVEKEAPWCVYTLHCTLYTLHSTLYILHCTHYTVHSTLVTLHSIPYTLHFTFLSHRQASALICHLHLAGSFASQQLPKRASLQMAPPSHALSSLQSNHVHRQPRTSPPEPLVTFNMWAPSSPQRARPSHALVPPTFPPSCTPPQNSNPSPLFYASIPSLFPLLFASFSIILLCFDSIFASFYPPFHSPQMHVGGRTRGESNPTVTQLPPGTSASKSTTVATLIRWGSASKVSVWRRPPPRTPYSHFVRNEQLRHA